MIKRVWDYYLLIMFCGQSLGMTNPNEGSLAKILICQFSFVGGSILVGMLTSFSRISPVMGSIYVGVVVSLFWVFGQKKIKKSINIKRLDRSFFELNKNVRILFYVIAILLYLGSFLLFFFFIILFH
jgi:hypothetical protein